MYEHKGFIALLRFAYPRSSGSTGYRNEERRKTGTPKPVYYSKRGLVLRTRLSRRKKPAEPAYFLPGFIRGQATTDNTNRAFVGYQSCDVFVDEDCFRLMSLFSLFEFWIFRRWRLFLLDFSWTLEKLEMQFDSVRFSAPLKIDLLAMEFEI